MRLHWENTTQGKPKTPQVELVRLLLDGTEVPTEHVGTGSKARPIDDYYVYHSAELTPGEHVATAVVRGIETREESQREIRFGTSDA